MPHAGVVSAIFMTINHTASYGMATIPMYKPRNTKLTIGGNIALNLTVTNKKTPHKEELYYW